MSMSVATEIAIQINCKIWPFDILTKVTLQLLYFIPNFFIVSSSKIPIKVIFWRWKIFMIMGWQRQNCRGLPDFQLCVQLCQLLNMHCTICQCEVFTALVYATKTTKPNTIQHASGWLMVWKLLEKVPLLFLQICWGPLFVLSVWWWQMSCKNWIPWPCTTVTTMLLFTENVCWDFLWRCHRTNQWGFALEEEQDKFTDMAFRIFPKWMKTQVCI